MKNGIIIFIYNFENYIIHKVGANLSISKKWSLPNPNKNLIEHISKKFNISPITAQVITNRGIVEDCEVDEFINPDINQFLDPYELPNMHSGVACIQDNIKNNNKIAVYGDYDVDGITSTYIVYDYLKSLDANVIFYIPNRSDEGYGLNKHAIDYLYSENVKLIITVDVGITAIEEVAYIKSRNMDVVVTDHHTPVDTLPNADAVINPKIPGCMYKNPNLAGVGVAFKLVYALSGLSKQIIDRYCVFACIGTIADMVPLTGENRFIASYGLKLIRQTDNFGLKALIDVSNIDINNIDSGNISFGIAPRLNAAGRIDSAVTSVNLFLSNNCKNAEKLAQILDSNNKLRQIEEQKILEEALEIIEKDRLYEDNVIIVAKQGWHHGIIGIVSSKITEKYYKPSAVISINDDGTGKASGRSISGFSLFDSLNYCSDVLIKFGGHELAAGFSVEEDKIDKFRRKINEYAQCIITEEIATPKLNIDAIIDASQITIELCDELNYLEPYGIGNRTPILGIYNTSVTNVRFHKSGKHAFLSLSASNCSFDSPAFNMADDLKIYSNGDEVDIAGTLNVNTYNGVKTAQFLIRDIKPTDKCRIDIDNLRILFVCIKNFLASNITDFRINELSDYINREYNRRLGRERIKNMLKIFDELNLINFNVKYDCVKISKGDAYHMKCDIEKSDIYKSISEKNYNS